MGSGPSRRSSSELGLLPCQHRRSRALQKRLYRASLFVAIMMFFVFQFSATTESHIPWNERAVYNGSSNNSNYTSHSTSNTSPVDVKNDSGYRESLFEKFEYAIIKFFVGKVVAAHQKRQKAAAALMNLQQTTEVTNIGEKTHRKPLAKRVESRRNLETIEYISHAKNTSNLEVLRNAHDINSRTISDTPKIIVLYTRFFGRRNWTGIFGNSTDLAAHNCPVSNCIFTYDLSKSLEADALIFHARDFKARAIPRVRKPHQRYIWLYHEAPGMENAGLNQVPDGFFNWTYTYHRESDLLLLYGGIQPIHGGDPNATRPGLLDPFEKTYRDYLKELQTEEKNTNQGVVESLAPVKLEATEGHPNSTMATTPSDPPDERKLIAWMVSHCNTWSGRELYVQELMQYVDVDTYGKCGPLTCGKTHHDSYCYSEVLATNYKFYLAFENSMCDDYITEKVWYPLHYGLVPVVYGGARYQDYLPPHSYVDATNMTPPQLAKLLTKLGSSSVLYNKYHIWRNYWRVVVPPPMCELCRRLHFDQKPSTVKNPQRWWKEVNNCTTHYSFQDYPRQDLRLMVTKVDAGIKLFRRMIESLF